MAINKTTIETKNKIKANSVIALPNRPQIPAEQLKQAFVKPIVDTSNSMIQELDRIVEETNAELEQVQVDITDSLDDHNTSNEAHEDIRQTISEHDFRINELEDFASNLEVDITEEIEQALSGKADLVDGKVPREQLPSYSYDEIIDKPVSVIFEITSFTELTSLQKTTITNQLMPLLNDNLTDLDTKKYSDLILRYLDERYHYSSVAVIDGEVVRILFDYKNEDTKIKLDINFVGDDSQTVIELVTINYEPEGTVSTHNTSETAHSDIRQKVDEAKAIAEGKSRARVFATKSALDAWLLDSENVALLQIGDNFYIEEIDKPDYWWNGTTIKELETQKVDLTEYAKKTDIPDITVNNGSAESGKYISAIAVDSTNKHKLNITKENLPTIPPISTSITTDATDDTKTASPKAVKTYVDNAINSAILGLLGGES